MSEFGGLRKHEKTQHVLKNNSWAGASHHVVATVLMSSVWVNAYDPCMCACCASSRCFEPWKLRLLKFFIIRKRIRIRIIIPLCYSTSENTWPALVQVWNHCFFLFYPMKFYSPTCKTLQHNHHIQGSYKYTVEKIHDFSMTFPGYFLNFPWHTQTIIARRLGGPVLSFQQHFRILYMKIKLLPKKKKIFKFPWPFHDFRQYFKFHEFSRPGIFTRFPWPVRTLHDIPTCQNKPLRF